MKKQNKIDVIGKQKREAYESSNCFDRTVNKILEDTPIEKFPYYWLTYCRTIKTTLDIIEQEAMKEIKK